MEGGREVLKLKRGAEQTGVRREGVGKGKKESDRKRRRKEGEEEEEGRGETRRWTSSMDMCVDFLETLKLIIMLLQLQLRFHQD